MPWRTRLSCHVPPGAFVQQTFSACEHAALPSLAAYFVFGREAMVPHLFKPWLAQLQHNPREETVFLVSYLKCHIELDSQSHFPERVYQANGGHVKNH